MGGTGAGRRLRPQETSLLPGLPAETRLAFPDSTPGYYGPQLPWGLSAGLALRPGHWGHSKWVQGTGPLAWAGGDQALGGAVLDRTGPWQDPQALGLTHRPHSQPRCRTQLTGQRGAEAAPEPLCPPSLAASCPPASNSGPCPHPHKTVLPGTCLGSGCALLPHGHTRASCPSPEWAICSSCRLLSAQWPRLSPRSPRAARNS